VGTTSVAVGEDLVVQSWDLWVPGADLSAFVVVARVPRSGRCWYWTAVVGTAAAPVVVVADLDVPSPARGLELRTDGLWADANLEEPDRRWSLGLEAFAVGVDDPAAFRSVDPATVRGDRIPYGFDLEWEADGVAQTGGSDARRPICEVRGELLVGTRSFELQDLGAVGTFSGPASVTVMAGSSWWGLLAARSAGGTGPAPFPAEVAVEVPLCVAPGVDLERRRWTVPGAEGGDGWAGGFSIS